MSVNLSNLRELSSLPFDEIIDVRSPSEFAYDHIPGAISLPVLSDEERAAVGTIYVQDDRFKARKIGAALVSRNAAHHLETYLADKPGSYRPLVYCWRGGQRSGSFTTILKQIGWRADAIDGGYQSYRKLVVNCLYDAPFPAPVVLLDGNTGTAKTEILNLLPDRGLQIIDLEGLAQHRGSLLGGRDGGQPSQKAFESALATEVTALDSRRTVVLEAESSKIGDRSLPPSIWAAMRSAPRLLLEAPLDERARYLARAYADVTRDIEELTSRLRPLHRRHSWDRVNIWIDMARAGDFRELAKQLMEQHYDPLYHRHDRAPNGPRITLDSLDPSALPGAAARVAKLAMSLTEA